MIDVLASTATGKCAWFIIMQHRASFWYTADTKDQVALFVLKKIFIGFILNLKIYPERHQSIQ